MPTAVADQLSSALGTPLSVVAREPNGYASSVTSEVVTCRTTAGDTLRLLLKSERPEFARRSHGHRRGARHEALVYRAVLEPLGVTAPRCHGLWPGGDGEGAWLVLEYLEGTMRVNQDPRGDAIVEAARWIGRFHAASAPLVSVAGEALGRYDTSYYEGWARRASEFAREAGDVPRWLATLCERAGGVLGELLDAEPAVVHGELYPHNVLLHDGQVVPVDWETAVVAAGEIDLASLTERWPGGIARACEEEYRRARWPHGAPGHHQRALDVARLYWPLRWLGDRPEWLEQERSRWRLPALRDAAERLALV